MNLLKRLFDFVLPAARRKRREVSDEALVSVLGNVQASDPVYSAVVEVIHQQFVEEVTALLRTDLGQAQARGGTRDGQVQVSVNQTVGTGALELQRGRAAALYGLLLRLENEREAAHQELAERRKRQARTAPQP